MARFHQMLLDKGNTERAPYSIGRRRRIDDVFSDRLHEGRLCPRSGSRLRFEVVREVFGTFRYNSIGSFVKGGAYRTYGWVDPTKTGRHLIFMQRTNGGGDVADEINSFMAMAASAIER